MCCTRCQGLMVERPWWRRRVLMWSCLNCGNCVDDTILFNRAMAKPETEAQRNERIWRRVKFQVSRSMFQVDEVGC